MVRRASDRKGEIRANLDTLNASDLAYSSVQIWTGWNTRRVGQIGSRIGSAQSTALRCGSLSHDANLADGVAASAVCKGSGQLGEAI